MTSFFQNKIKRQKNIIYSSPYNDTEINLINLWTLPTHTYWMKEGMNTHERKPDKLSLLYMESCAYKNMNNEVTDFKQKKKNPKGRCCFANLQGGKLSA